MIKPKIIIVGGATASGKSAIALKLCSEFGGALISADSMQIYKRLDIGTAKPTLSERTAIRHYLIDIKEPWENYSAADFVCDAKAAINDALSRGMLPVICGGTGLYIEALIHPTEYDKSTGIDDILREKLSARDAHSLWEELNAIDPEAASAIHENNKKRVVRALEIYYNTGKTKTETDREQKKYNSDFDYLLLITDFSDRDALYEKINRRVDIMVKNGLVEETRELLERKDLREGTTAYQAIGYKELFPYFNGEKSLDECIDKLKQATRNYAKRQITWFSRYDCVRVRDYKDAQAAVKTFLKGGDGNG